MAKILVFNNDSNRMETYYRGEGEAMPYNVNRTLTVGEFRGSSKSNTLWTTKRAMQSFNGQRALFAAPIPVGYAFKRPYEGGHGTMSQHYAGVSFDAGQTLSTAQRNRLWTSAATSGLWTYVEPKSLTPTWVHFDKRFGTPACSTGGYPLIRQGSISTYVLVAQDCLNTLGFSTNGLDGIFGSGTKNAVIRFQNANGLSADGVVGCNTWRELTGSVVGRGRTNTTIN